MEDSMTEESLDIITKQSIEDDIQHMLDVQEESEQSEIDQVSLL